MCVDRMRRALLYLVLLASYLIVQIKKNYNFLFIPLFLTRQLESENRLKNLNAVDGTSTTSLTIVTNECLG
jgi:hypothetical protein